MESYQVEKQRFVEERLAPMLVAMTHGDIAGVEYVDGGCEEYVDVTFRSGYEKSALVTGDSLRAIVEDVLAIL